MPRLPAFLEVGPVTFEVVADDSATAELRKHDDDTAFTRGLTDVAEARIYLEPSLPPSAAAVTLAHEAIHAMLDHAPTGLTAAQEEAVATTLGPRLVELVRQNPELIAYLRRPTR